MKLWKVSYLLGMTALGTFGGWVSTVGIPFEISCYYQVDSDDREWCLDREGYLRNLRSDYARLKADKYTYRGAQYLAEHKAQIEYDLDYAFNFYNATFEELGFTREDYLGELERIIMLHTSI